MTGPVIPIAIWADEQKYRQEDEAIYRAINGRTKNLENYENENE